MLLEEKNPPKISLIFLYWNAPEWTIASLESIKRYMKTPFELIIVNNGSDKDLVDKVNAKVYSMYNTNAHMVNYSIINN